MRRNGVYQQDASSFQYPEP